MNELELNEKRLPIASKDVDALEEKFLELPQVACGVTHKFGPGVYMREVRLPKASYVIGHHQNFEHVCIFIKGRITFFKDEGPVEMSAPLTFVAKPGRKIAYIHEDSIFINVYPTNETDVEKLEAHYLTKSDAWMNDLKEQEKIQLLTSTVDKNDFSLVKCDYWTRAEFIADANGPIDLPFGDYKFKTGPSKIDGVGLFATSDIDLGEIIGPCRIGLKITVIERFANHSASPNAKLVKKDESSDDTFLVATKKILGCHGGRDGEEITINYREFLHKIEERLCQQ